MTLNNALCWLDILFPFLFLLLSSGLFTIPFTRVILLRRVMLTHPLCRSGCAPQKREEPHKLTPTKVLFTATCTSSRSAKSSGRLQEFNNRLRAASERSFEGMGKGKYGHVPKGGY
eukprot:jgi/Phyca11/14771/fgenesh1_pg.PHYCAscaffold_9_\